MALSIREALNFGGLFGAKVIAGEEKLDNIIGSISVLEVADRTISRWVIQDQLYITLSCRYWQKKNASLVYSFTAILE